MDRMTSRISLWRRIALLLLPALALAGSGGGCSSKGKPSGAQKSAGAVSKSSALDREFGGPPVTVRLRCERTEIGLADRARFAIEIHPDPGFEADFPEYLPEDFEGLAVTRVETRDITPARNESGGEESGSGSDREPTASGEETSAPVGNDTVPGGRVHVREFTLEPDRSGELTIAPLEVYYHASDEKKENVVRTEEVVIRVAPLDDPTDLEIRAHRGILEGPPRAPEESSLAWVLAGGAGLLVAAFLGYFWWRGRRARVRPPTPPHEVAWENLRLLVQAGWIEKGEIERFFVLLSSILRIYVEQRFGVRAPELTTEEFLEAASRSSDLGSYRGRLGEFLALCDQVKFARYEPESSTIQSSFDVVKLFVQETTPHGP